MVFCCYASIVVGISFTKVLFNFSLLCFLCCSYALGKPEPYISYINCSYKKLVLHIFPISFRPSLVWGNQEPMWPISRAALKAVASERVETMARSKTNLQENFPEKCSR